MRSLGQAFRLLVAALRAVAWCAVTLWLGAKAIVRLAVLLSRWRQITAEVLHCPRGHEVVAFGLWNCQCGARLEGWCFRACDICGESARWIGCAECGLPVQNPLDV